MYLKPGDIKVVCMTEGYLETVNKKLKKRVKNRVPLLH